MHTARTSGGTSPCTMSHIAGFKVQGVHIPLQGEEAHLFVGVTIREPQKGTGMPRMASLLVRRSIIPASVAAAADGGNAAADDDASYGDSASGDWQPSDTILEDPEASNPSACSMPGALQVAWQP